MSATLRILIVEDNPSDVRLVLHALRQSGIEPEWRQVETEPDYVAQLDSQPDVVLADYNLPQFDALRALELLQQRQPSIPFIIVSGTIGEEAAVEAIRRGAADYVLKDRLGRLGAAIRQALEQRRLRNASQEAERALSENRERTRLVLEQQNVELRRSNQELDDFAYIASHDLKEPLRGIHNYAVFLAEDYTALLDDHGRAMLQTLERLTQRMEALINSLLETSRVGRIEFALQETNLNDVLAEVLDSLRNSLDEAKVEVRTPGPLPTLRCDRVRVGEVFQNLITNAIKYNDKPRKWIEIGALPAPPLPEAESRAPASEAHPADIVFYVRDNGIGIREKQIGSIFRIFKRLNGHEEFGGGTGVGLTIVKKIVERHGGRIWVESSFSEGSSFYFTLAADRRVS